MLTIDDAVTVFNPGEKLSGVLSYDFRNTARPAYVTLRLGWCCEGESKRDVLCLTEDRIPLSASTGSYPFEATIPHGPYSYDGKFARARWVMEAVGADSREWVRRELEVGLG